MKRWFPWNLSVRARCRETPRTLDARDCAGYLRPLASKSSYMSRASHVRSISRHELFPGRLFLRSFVLTSPELEGRTDQTPRGNILIDSSFIAKSWRRISTSGLPLERLMSPRESTPGRRSAVVHGDGSVCNILLLVAVKSAARRHPRP